MARHALYQLNYIPSSYNKKPILLCVCKFRRKLSGLVFSFTFWVLGIKLGSSGLVANAFTC